MKTRATKAPRKKRRRMTFASDLAAAIRTMLKVQAVLAREAPAPVPPAVAHASTPAAVEDVPPVVHVDDELVHGAPIDPYAGDDAWGRR